MQRRLPVLRLRSRGRLSRVPGAIALRGSDARALVDEALSVLDRPTESVVVSLLIFGSRTGRVSVAAPRLLELRAATGQPHWIVLDEAHHHFPRRRPSDSIVPAQLNTMALVTVHPDHMAPSMLRLVDTLIVVGREPQVTLDAFARGRGEKLSSCPNTRMITPPAWLVLVGSPPVVFECQNLKATEGDISASIPRANSARTSASISADPEGRLNCALRTSSCSCSSPTCGR